MIGNGTITAASGSLTGTTAISVVRRHR
jgi:hypothetical protein